MGKELEIRKNEIDDILKRFLDGEGRIKLWPTKREKQKLVLAYLAQFFTPGESYTEPEINEMIKAKHTFEDLFLLRRGLVDQGHLNRTKDGRRYWRELTEPQR